MSGGSRSGTNDGAPLSPRMLRRPRNSSPEAYASLLDHGQDIGGHYDDQDHPPLNFDASEPFYPDSKSPTPFSEYSATVYGTEPQSGTATRDVGFTDASRTNLEPPRPRKDSIDEEFDDEIFYSKFGQPPSRCSSDKDIHQARSSWLCITIYVLSIYSTVMSGIWLFVAIIQPRWGHGISSHKGLAPATATTITALIAKTIEMSFVSVFVACLGQILSRRSFVRKATGLTLAEMTMRNWVFQPGSLVTHAETLPSTGLTLLGLFVLTSTFATSFYTTASDAMVSPKLKYGHWEKKVLDGYVRAPYASSEYVSETCPSLFAQKKDVHAEESCMNVQFSGQSYRNLLNFMSTWTDMHENGTKAVNVMSNRPLSTTLLYDNTSMTSAWIETEHSDVQKLYDETGRIINNVTLAMPHPGVYAAATGSSNGILQPDDLDGIGSYAIRAGVVSPAINVMCINVDKKEIAPLVYTSWKHAEVEKSGVGNQLMPKSDDWAWNVPSGYLNRTDLDHFFKWGPKYKRHPPVFELFPIDYNIVTNTTIAGGDAMYVLGKPPATNNFTVCELRSWVSPNCSTHFNVSGTTGTSMTAHCEDRHDPNSYLRSYDGGQKWAPPSVSWLPLAAHWALSMELNAGAVNGNASHSRILTQLALQDPVMSKRLPSMAEALAVYASSSVMLGAIGTPWVHYWDDKSSLLESPGLLRSFNASLITEEYTSGHTSGWQSLFYVVLGIVFLINICCLVYFLFHSGLVTDFTEPQNIFAVALNSPPSVHINGACGGGPSRRHLVVPWRIAYAPSANHYFFKETHEPQLEEEMQPGHGAAPLDQSQGYSTATATAARSLGKSRLNSYKKLSSKNWWL